MARANGEVTEPFGDGKHTFRLGITQLEELQEKCDAGPAFVLRRLIAFEYLVSDVRETIRLGLIGGGMEAKPALLLVERYVDDLDKTPFAESAGLASAILNAAIFGPDDDQLGKPPAGA